MQTKVAEVSSGKQAQRKPAGSSGIYNSQFLKDKVDEQKLKKKAARKTKRDPAAKEEDDGVHKNFDPLAVVKEGAAGAKAAAIKKKVGGTDVENLEELVEELQNDLTLRDAEWETMRDKIEKLEAQNEWLRTKVIRERESKMTIESKLNKVINMKEIDQNFALINESMFFDAQKKQKMKEDRLKEQMGVDKKSMIL